MESKSLAEEKSNMLSLLEKVTNPKKRVFKKRDKPDQKKLNRPIQKSK